jgi:general secretion pathway protein G
MLGNTHIQRRKGFSLVELVVVILILGILAAVAAPRMFDTANNARDNGTRSSLTILRDAIELYRADNSAYPPAATLATALRPYIKGSFPAVQTGPNRNANVVASTQNPISTPEAGTAGWAYNATTGDIVVNAATYIAW